ncbi:MAG: MBL fold metallo-hydrolase [Thaumarchaeota archaeon]|nr:MBL fold metallo-hydrolase [Nitrososphaerota archaeon]
MGVLQIPVGPMQNFTYLIWDDETKEAAIIDPSWDLDKVLKEAEARSLKIRYILNTHTHHDHCLGNEYVKKKTGAETIGGKGAKVKIDKVVGDGEHIPLGQSHIEVISTPGHSPDSVCYLFQGNLFTGDTLFVGECGRTDLPGGSAEDLYESLFNKILRLDDSIKVYPGHDYGFSPHSTIGYERKNNYTLKQRTKEEFVRFMTTP